MCVCVCPPVQRDKPLQPFSASPLPHPLRPPSSPSLDWARAAGRRTAGNSWYSSASGGSAHGSLPAHRPAHRPAPSPPPRRGPHRLRLVGARLQRVRSAHHDTSESHREDGAPPPPPAPTTVVVTMVNVCRGRGAPRCHSPSPRPALSECSAAAQCRCTSVKRPWDLQKIIVINILTVKWRTSFVRTPGSRVGLRARGSG